jgi:hypothetical protein
MRLVTIDNLEYEKFEKIRDLLVDPKKGVPYGLSGSPGYSKELHTGFFHFWDEFYIPRSLMKFIKRPPGTEDKMQNLSERIKDVLYPSQVKE